MAICILVRLRIDVADIPAAIAVMGDMTRLSQAEKGCIHYAFAQDVNEPGVFHLSELWDSGAALDAHHASRHNIDGRATLDALRVLDRYRYKFDVVL